jgi:hypothetical protein
MLAATTTIEQLPRFLSVAQVQGYFGIGRSAAYAFPRVYGVRVGRRTPRILQMEAA